VPIYSPAFADTHCAYPWRGGQAELTRVAGYIHRWFTHPQTVTRPSTNWAWHRVTVDRDQCVNHGATYVVCRRWVLVSSRHRVLPASTTQFNRLSTLSLLVVVSNTFVVICQLCTFLLGTYWILAPPSAGPAASHFCQIWLRQNFC